VETATDQQFSPQRLDDHQLRHLWSEFLKALEGMDERVGGILRAQCADPVLPTSLSNHISSTWGPEVNKGLQAVIWPEPFDFHARLFRTATPLLMSAAQRVHVNGFRVSELHISDVWSTGLTIGMTLPYTDLAERVERCTTNLDAFFHETYEAHERTGSVPTIRVDKFELTHPEAILYRALQEQGLIFSPQTWIVHQKKPRYRVDFMIYYEGTAYAVEVDGHDWHKSKRQRAYDAARDRFLEMRGVSTIRFTGSEIHRDVRGCVFQLIDCLVKVKGRESLPLE
jgi:very-short-patch-repair endonuclease